MSPRSSHRTFVAEQLKAGAYEQLVATHGERCALCDTTPKTRRLNLDHDHKTMRVRGLLCHRCNRALPAWISVAWLERAANYLRRDTDA